MQLTPRIPLAAGEWDGAGAVIKRALRIEQRLNPSRQLQNAKDCVEFLTETLSTRTANSYQKQKADICRKFWHIQESEVVRSNPFGCATIPGSRSLHSIFSFSAADPTKLMVRQLSCYCPSCIDEDWENCQNTGHVQPWRCIKLRPTDTDYVRDVMMDNVDQDDWAFGGDGEEMSDLINVGDNFVVPAEAENEEGVEFYILQCQIPKFRVVQPFQCVWGCEFDAGDYVIGGTYYQKWGISSKSFVYLAESRTTYVDAHLVRMCKFPLPPAHHRVKGDDSIYQLSDDTLALIKSALQEGQ